MKKRSVKKWNISFLANVILAVITLILLEGSLACVDGEGGVTLKNPAAAAPQLERVAGLFDDDEMVA